MNHVYIYNKVTHCAGHILANTRPHQLCCMGSILVLLFCEFISHSLNRNLINATGQSNLIFYIISQLCTKYRLLLALIQAFFGSSISLQLHTSYRAATKVITRPKPNMQIIVRMCTCVLLRRLDAKYLCSVHLT